MWSSSVNLLLLTFLIYVSEDVIENKVSGGLLGEDEGLTEFLELGGFVRGFTDDLNDDVLEGTLGVDVGDTDFAVLKVEFADTFLDSLLKLDKSVLPCGRRITHRSANRHWRYFGLKARNELGSFAIEKLSRVSNDRESKQFADIHEASRVTCST